MRAMKGTSQACVLYAKVLLHGVHVDLELLQSKRTSMEQEKENVEERFMPTLESKIHCWLVDAVPKDIQTKASNRAHTLSARMLIVDNWGGRATTRLPKPCHPSKKFGQHFRG